jgi:hypothetical protein
MGIHKIGPDFSVKRFRVRVRKEDSAYAYALLEAHEGIASYSTLPHPRGDSHRVLELTIPVAFVSDVSEIVEEWVTEGWAEPWVEILT